jgi:hypothetical protein
MNDKARESQYGKPIGFITLPITVIIPHIRRNKKNSAKTEVNNALFLLLQFYFWIFYG